MAVNKTDDKRARGRAVEFYQLGFEPVVEMAAEHGEGIGDLLDEIIERDALNQRRGPRAEDAGRNRGRDRRPAERRQVFAAQPVTQGRAVDRQRHAGDDEGYRGRDVEVASAARSASSIRRASGGRDGWRAAGRSSR